MPTGPNGSDSFIYRANDGVATSNPATVSVTIVPVNDPPDAVDDFATVRTHVWTTIRVRKNDLAGPDGGEKIRVVGVTRPGHGTAKIVDNGRAVRYRSARRFRGIDSFTYTIGDGNGGQDTATVTVTVRRR